MAHVVEPLPSVFVGLAFFENGPSDDVSIDGKVGDGGNALGYLLTLVVASFTLSIFCKGNGENAVYVMEKVDAYSFLCQETSHVKGYLRVMGVFQLVEDVAGEGMSFVIKQGAGFLYGNLMPEHFRHLVLIGILPRVGPWEVQVASHADAFFLSCQTVAADGAETRKKQVDDFR